MAPQKEYALPRQRSLLLPAVINPFVHDLKLTKADKIKCFLLGIILVPLRGIFLLLVLMVMWPISVMITFRQPLKGAVEPMTGWRRFMHKRVMTFLGWLYFFGMGFRVVVKGKQASSVQAPILAVAPHSSFFDAIVCIEAGLPSTVSRSESLEAPIFGRFLRCVQPVLVSRKDPDSRRNTILEIERRAKSGGHWPQVLIFPEGTCTNRSCLITFKQGAFVPGVPVQPVLIRYPNKLDTVTWTWQGPKSARLLLLTLCQLYTTVEVEFLPPQIPTEIEKKCPFKFAKSVRAVMAESLGLPVTDHTYEDCRLMIAAGELTLPMEAGLVEFTKISRKLELKWDSVKKELESFANIACSCKGGRITIEEFSSFLKLPISPALQELFALFDRNGDGTIDFREYVIGVTVLCRPANNEEVIQTAFKLFDIDEDNCITQEEFSSLLRSALGVRDLEVHSLFKEIDADGSGHITYDEFCSFALTHPEYAKLFTTYLELQRYQGLQGEEPDFEASLSHCCTASHNHQEDSTSDKKDD
ncbi:lysophosphatidylcholine acyltransferase 2-like isoform X1 [Cyprinus carpio]|uniref:Lysophosphatidylcholine acyltransferase 2 n=2 Tax=Cyprinus carpio TaxID=7962 RepID=A0A8C1VGN3_CYPCA|nr:lysophosphatidylcholine acyltransferase 2-like isoform X1 [Cyprinus carpio]XP_042616243.1 lysophosphatidylcholine acyltransferase 2-like isoform X1 [Cyprinus carpio]XP_042616244.1 lysophosphatidylcholine acyltransferase 2-like isoform X1 [Cyprinus carpio]